MGQVLGRGEVRLANVGRKNRPVVLSNRLEATVRFRSWSGARPSKPDLAVRKHASGSSTVIRTTR